MSCLNVIIRNLCDSTTLNAENFGVGIEAHINRLGVPLFASIKDTLENKHLKVNCGIVCSIGNAYVTVQSGTIELDYLGTPVPRTVESNAIWTVE